MTYGTHLRVLSKSYPMNTTMAGFRWFSKNICALLLWMKAALVLEGLRQKNIYGWILGWGLQYVSLTCCLYNSASILSMYLLYRQELQEYFISKITKSSIWFDKPIMFSQYLLPWCSQMNHSKGNRCMGTENRWNKCALRCCQRLLDIKSNHQGLNHWHIL